MNRTPSYRLMARAGVPIAKLLLARRQFADTSPWTLLEYAMAASLSVVTLAVGLYGASLAMDLFKL